MELRTGPEARLSQRIDNQIGVLVNSLGVCTEWNFNQEKQVALAGYRDTITT